MSDWQKLPIPIQQIVVSKLDYLSRCRLRKCSKSDQALVDATPTHLNYLSVQIDEQSIQIRFRNFSVSYRDVIGCNIVRIQTQSEDFCRRTELVNCNKNQGIDLAIIDFLVLIRNLRIEKFHLKCSMCFISRERKRNFMKSLTEQMRFADLKLKTVLFHCDFAMRNEEFTSLMRRFDSKVLKELFLGDNFLDEKCEVFEKKQWRNLKKISVLLPNSIPVANFFHIERFSTFAIKLSPHLAWAAIQTTLARNTINSEFSIGSCEELDYHEILQKFNVPLKNEPVDRPWINGHILHTQRFPMGNLRNYQLVVMILPFRVAGRVFRV